MKYEEAKESFENLFLGKMEDEEARSFLVKMAKRGESVEEISAAVEVMRRHSIKLPVSNDLQEKLIDNCGTGGDGSGSFNISTTVSLVLAGAGCYVAKHGNRSITSKSGSADMLEELGVRLNLDPSSQVKMLEECGFTFIFAAAFHPAMKFIMPIRKSIPHRTIFNILGPLTNPAGVKKQMVGVFSKEFVLKIAKTLKRVGSTRALVVSSFDGLDEISVSDRSKAAMLQNSEIEEIEIDPLDYGIKRYSIDEIKGADAKDNAKITWSILSAEERGAKRDIVLVNTAAALVVDGKATSIEEGIEIAKEVIDSGRAKLALEKIIKVSNSL